MKEHVCFQASIEREWRASQLAKDVDSYVICDSKAKGFPIRHEACPKMAVCVGSCRLHRSPAFVAETNLGQQGLPGLSRGGQCSVNDPCHSFVSRSSSAMMHPNAWHS